MVGSAERFALEPDADTDVVLERGVEGTVGAGSAVGTVIGGAAAVGAIMPVVSGTGAGTLKARSASRST